MCVKLPLGYLSSDRYPLHTTSIYTCGVTITLRVCGGHFTSISALSHLSILKININQTISSFK